MSAARSLASASLPHAAYASNSVCEAVLIDAKMSVDRLEERRLDACRPGALHQIAHDLVRFDAHASLEVAIHG